MSDVYTLRIDDRDVAGAAGETILEVARENGISVPTLCHLEGLKPIGACRMCLVEVRQTGRLMPACTTRIEEGQDIVANSERLHAYRRQVLEPVSYTHLDVYKRQHRHPPGFAVQKESLLVSFLKAFVERHQPRGGRTG